MASSKFRSILRDANEGTVLKPLLRSYLTDALWPDDFAIWFRKGSSRRDPDGWFHPSEHPTWPERMLWWLLVAPDKMVPEVLEYQNTLSVTMGTAVHGFIEMCLKDMGVMLDKPRLQELGFDVNDKSGEPHVFDVEAGSRGHMDGVLELFLPQFPREPYPLFELKTSNQNTLASIEDLDLAGFIKKWPGYYAQAQEYLRMANRQVSVVLFIQMGFPWTQREFHIPANPRYQADTHQKYLRVRSAVASGQMPSPCCAPNSAQSRDCPARLVCPMGEQK